MNIKISDLETFYNQTFPEDDKYGFEELEDLLFEDLDLTVAKALGAEIEISENEIIIGDYDKTMNALKEACRLSEEDYPQFASYFDFCDGGDDIDYAGSFPGVLGDLLDAYKIEINIKP